MGYACAIASLTRRSFLGGTLAWTTILLAGCGQAQSGPPASSKPGASGATSPAGSPKPAVPGTASAVKGAWVAITANQMIWPLALDAGYFDKYGVNFTLQYVQGSVTSVQALVAGDLQMVQVAGSAVVAAQASKQDLVLAAGYIDRLFWRIMGLASITSLDQLRGKTIGVGKVGNADYFAWTLLAQKQGWKMEDFQFVNAGDSQGQVTLLQKGAVQGTALSPPQDLQAQQVGAHLLLDEAQYNQPEQQLGVALPLAYIAKNRTTALNVLKATIEAIHRWKTDAPFAKGVIKKYLKNDDQAYIDAGYSAYTPLFLQAPYPNAQGFQAVIDEVATQQPQAKNVTPAQCMDTSLLKELEDSGFIKQLYGS
ncbi:MAG: ABC transporter substrate-binding protein [Chloroflexota bacterium]